MGPLAKSDNLTIKSFQKVAARMNWGFLSYLFIVITITNGYNITGIQYYSLNNFSAAYYSVASQAELTNGTVIDVASVSHFTLVAFPVQDPNFSMVVWYINNTN